MANSLELSPLQIKQLIFTEVNLGLGYGLDKADEAWAPTFDMQGVELKVDVTLAISAENPKDDPRDFMVTVRLDVPNDAGKPCPYRLRMEAVGFFVISPGIPAADREEIVRVNGASLIIGAMREMIATVSSRAAFGPLLLPTLRVVPNPSLAKAQ